MKSDVLWSYVYMDCQKKCVLLASNEHEIVFVEIDHNTNKSACP